MANNYTALSLEERAARFIDWSKLGSSASNAVLNFGSVASIPLYSLVDSQYNAAKELLAGHKKARKYLDALPCGNYYVNEPEVIAAHCIIATR